ncbi:Fe-S cluster assembly sulfur transfer protein SufU [Alkalilimnicola sp. S0819]|uniref:Fe-S cluster assembly sulfur transfer protein SufU n=1 Tax=Alkalilimnicola sp. S0819 TaxID=2613922 RepID=UPI0012614328|nr:SUF system NifU family Fe-S cluster assembly protein [Alkalilimnicola sp. S0819]KAB7623631.1 SUF system NifU family Fe-S cluster assembly protein [Alkalilimnicola sp. S0819]MPQ16755.1 SUF system NifU family Fe-S cluster assembly protein [Alkalilimnicola sp. S0819]
MSRPGSLYQAVVLAHNREPRNQGRLAEPTHRVHAHNPLCGDELELFLRVEGGRLVEVAFDGEGCAIATASASIMSEALKGRPLSEAEGVLARFRALLAGQQVVSSPDGEDDPLLVLAGVRAYPARIKCANLPWQAFQAALAGQGEATTE